MHRFSLLSLALLLATAAHGGEAPPPPNVAGQEESRQKWVVLYRTFAMQGIMAHTRAMGLILEQKANAPTHLLAHAQALNHYALQMEELFREKAMDDETIAKEEIWEKWPTFQEQSRVFQKTTERVLGEAKTGPTPGLAKALEEMGNSCKECHKLFRSKR